MVLVLASHLDHLDAAVDGPEQSEVSASVHKVGVRPGAQEGLGALEPPPVGGAHQGSVPLLAAVGSAEHKVDVRALFDLWSIARAHTGTKGRDRGGASARWLGQE